MKFARLFSLVAAVVVLLSLTAGCSNAQASTATTTTAQAFQVPANFTTYKDENSLFSISYPNQWEPATDLVGLNTQMKDAVSAIKSGLPIDKTSILFMSGLKTTTGYYPGLAVVVEPAPTLVLNNGLAVQAEVNGIKQVDPNLQEISRTKITVNGKDATILEYKAHFSATTPLMHNIALICLDGRTIWSVTCSAQDTDFDQFSSDYNNVVRSLQLTK
jgi:hypothetical protein